MAPDAKTASGQCQDGQAPSLALDWALQSSAKAGTLSVIGVYTMTAHFFPWGKAMNIKLTVKAGNCPYWRYLPHLVEMVTSGAVDPRAVLSHEIPFDSGVQA